MKTISFAFCFLLATVAVAHDTDTPDYTAKQLGELFLEQQEGIDTARTIQMGWESSFNGKRVCKTKYLFEANTLHVFKSYAYDTKRIHEYYYDFARAKSIQLTTLKDETNAVIRPYIDSAGIEAIWQFFPSLNHFGDFLSSKSRISMWREHSPEKLESYFELFECHDTKEVVAMLMKKSRINSRENPPRFSFPPKHFAKATPGNILLGCRKPDFVWFDILECEIEPFRLVKMIRYANMSRLPRDVLRELNSPRLSNEDLWLLQKEYASVFRELRFNTHKELERRIVIPLIVESKTFDEQGATTNTYRITKVVIDGKITERNFVIPEGTIVCDMSLDPLGKKRIEYIADSKRAMREWQSIIVQQAETAEPDDTE